MMKTTSLIFYVGQLAQLLAVKYFFTPLYLLYSIQEFKKIKMHIQILNKWECNAYFPHNSNIA